MQICNSRLKKAAVAALAPVLLWPGGLGALALEYMRGEYQDGTRQDLINSQLSLLC